MDDGNSLCRGRLPTGDQLVLHAGRSLDVGTAGAGSRYRRACEVAVDHRQARGVSYSDELAQAHSREARQLINEHADYLGFRLSADKTAVSRWCLDGHAGGLLATGIIPA
jgi:hypothetical protein